MDGIFAACPPRRCSPATGSRGRLGRALVPGRLGWLAGRPPQKYSLLTGKDFVLIHLDRAIYIYV
jgi:hypothetical protein